MKKMNRKFKHANTSGYIGNTTIKTAVSFWTWTKGRGLMVVFADGRKWKSAYKLPELLSGKPEGRIIEV